MVMVLVPRVKADDQQPHSSLLQVPFLNLMALITERAGEVDIRVGGNTQEYAVEVSSLPDYKAIVKDGDDTTNPVNSLCRSGETGVTDPPLQTETPTLLFTPELIYMLANVSSLVNVKWYLGRRNLSPLPRAKLDRRDRQESPSTTRPTSALPSLRRGKRFWATTSLGSKSAMSRTCTLRMSRPPSNPPCYP